MSINGIIAGLIAGAAGAAAWAAIAFYANLEIGYLAWGIGAFVGYVIATVGRSPSPTAGVVAVLITIASICAGKYVMVEMDIKQQLADIVAEDGQAAVDSIPDEEIAQARNAQFMGSFGGMDLLFFGLAIFSAWGLASNTGEEEEEEVT